MNIEKENPSWKKEIPELMTQGKIIKMQKIPEIDTEGFIIENPNYFLPGWIIDTRSKNYLNKLLLMWARNLFDNGKIKIKDLNYYKIYTEDQIKNFSYLSDIYGTSMSQCEDLYKKCKKCRDAIHKKINKERKIIKRKTKEL